MHLADKRQGFADKQVGMAFHPTCKILRVMIFQFVLGIRQCNLYTVRIVIGQQLDNRLDKTPVGGIQIDCFIISVYKTEKLGLCQYKVIHIFSV